jgi:hypothetical protein
VNEIELAAGEIASISGGQVVELGGVRFQAALV